MEGRSLTRSELKAVIRRAAELYATDGDERGDDRITEEELLRIAAELGLPAPHVRQALFELPETDAAARGASLLDQLLGDSSIAAGRVVPSDAELTLHQLEEYLTTREYLQLRRRQPGRALFAPADDAISRLARVISRPAARFHVARAHRVGLAVRSLEPGFAQTRIEVDLSNRRREAATSASVFGGLVGIAVGASLAAIAGAAGGDLLGTFGSVTGSALGLGGGLASGIGGGLAIARVTYRRRLASARAEIEGLLDRLQQGERLDPPPAPWRRRLRSGLYRRLPPGR